MAMLRFHSKHLITITALLAAASVLGCEKKPELDKVRFEVAATEPVVKLVTFESTPPTDTSTKFHGIGEKGITLTAGIAIVLNIEPRSDEQPEPLDGELSAIAFSDTATCFTATEVWNDEKPKRRTVLLALRPGTGKLHVTVSGHGGSVDIPITVK